MPPKILLRRPQKPEETSSSITSSSPITASNNTSPKISSPTTNSMAVIEQKSSGVTTTHNQQQQAPPPSFITLDSKFSDLINHFSEEFLNLNLHKELDLVPVGCQEEQNININQNNRNDDDDNDENQKNDELAKMAQNPTSPFSNEQEKKNLQRRYKLIAHAISSKIFPVIFRVLSSSSKNTAAANEKDDSMTTSFEQEEDTFLEEIIEPLVESPVVETLDSAVFTLVQDSVAIESCLEFNVLSLVSHWRINLVSKYCAKRIAKIVEKIESQIRKFVEQCHQELQQIEHSGDSDNTISSEKQEQKIRQLYSDFKRNHLERLFIQYRRYSGIWRQTQKDHQHLLSLCKGTRLSIFKNFAAGEALLYQAKVLEGDLMREQTHALMSSHALHQSLKSLAIFLNSNVEQLAIIAKKERELIFSGGIDDDDRDNNRNRKKKKETAEEDEKKLYSRNNNRNNNKKQDLEDDENDEDFVNTNSNSNSSSLMIITPAEIDRLVGIRGSEIPNQSLISFFSVFQKYQDAITEVPYRAIAYQRIASLCLKFPVFKPILPQSDDSTKDDENNRRRSLMMMMNANENEDDEYAAAKENENMFSLNICYWLARAVCSPVDSLLVVESCLESLKKQLKQCVKEAKKRANDSVTSCPFDVEILAISCEIFSTKLKQQELDEVIVSKWSSRFKERCLKQQQQQPELFYLRYSILFLILAQGDETMILNLLEVLSDLFLSMMSGQQQSSSLATSTTLSSSIALVTSSILSPSRISKELRSKLLSIRDLCDSLQLASPDETRIGKMFADFEDRHQFDVTNCDEEMAGEIEKYSTIITADDREIFGIPKNAARLHSLLKERRNESENYKRLVLSSSKSSFKNNTGNGNQKLLKGFLIEIDKNGEELSSLLSSSSLFQVSKISVEEYREWLSVDYRVGFHRHDVNFVERSFSSREDTDCLRLIRLSKRLRKLFE